MQHKILIGAPVSSRSWILPYFLNHIYNLDFDKKQVILCFLANNIKDNSILILKEFQQTHKHEYLDIIIEIYNSPVIFNDERTQLQREKYTYLWLSTLRNKLLQKCVELDCSYFLSCDSDILLRSDTLSRLLSHDLPIASGLIYNGYILSPEEPYKFTNILKETSHRTYTHISNYRTKFPEKNPIGKLIECDFTGALCLMTNQVCSKTKYDFHLQGEDEFWSYSAKKSGFKLFCDVSLFNYHIMSPEHLQLFLDGKL